MQVYFLKLYLTQKTITAQSIY